MKKLLNALLLSGLVTAGIGGVDSTQEVKNAADQTTEKATQAEKNIVKAQHLLEKESVEAKVAAPYQITTVDTTEVKKAVDNAVISAKETKKQAKKVSDAAGKISNKHRDVAHATTTANRSAKEATAAVQEAKHASENAQEAVKKAQTEVQAVKDAHDAGDTQKAQEHTSILADLVEEVEAEFKDIDDKLFTAHKKADVADKDSVKVQMLMSSQESRRTSTGKGPRKMNRRAWEENAGEAATDNLE